MMHTTTSMFRSPKKRHEIMRLVVQGYSNAEIAKELAIKVSLVKWHVTKLLKDNGVKQRAKLIALKNADAATIKALQLKISYLEKELQHYKTKDKE